VAPNPALDPDLVLPALATTHAGAGLRLVMIEVGGRLEACLPIRRIDRWHRFVRPGLTARLDDEPVSVLPVLGAPLVGPEHADAVVVALVHQVTAEARRLGASWLVLERLQHGGPLATLLGSACAAARLPTHRYDYWERPVLRRRPSADGWAAGLSAQRLRDNAKKRRRLERETETAVRVVERTGEPDAVEDLLALEAAGWKGAQGSAMANRAEQAAFFRACVSRLEALGRSHLLALMAGDAPVAMGWAVRSGDGLYFMRIAHDERFARCSPGGQLEVAMAEFFQRATDAAVLDPCCDPVSRYHTHFLPDRQPVASLLVATGGRRDRALVRLLPASIRVRQALGRAPDGMLPTGLD
jgi:CelD/BcsL family acetyltransferase involved in cellulose biosynthesis